MAVDARALAALSARVVASLPRDEDGHWDATHVSTSLRDLHASLRLQLAGQEAQTATLDNALAALCRGAPRAARGLLNAVEQTARDADDVAQHVDRAAAHFAELVERIGPQLERLRGLDARAAYLATALEIERRSQQAKRRAVEATPAALDAFRAFAAFVATVPSEFTALRKEAMRRVDELSLGIKAYAVDKLRAALESVEWPRALTKRELDTEKPKLVEIARAFAYLLTLHVSQLQAEDAADGTRREDKGKDTDKDDATAAAAVELWAMECVLEPIRLRFKYHFERAESKTNRATKPEWWLSHVLDQTRAHGAFLSHVLTPELQKHGDVLECVDAQVLFLRGLVVSAMRKLRKGMPAIQKERIVFCHTIDEVLLFEQAVDDEFGYDAYALAKPSQFPRVVNVLTEEPETLLAWTKLDLDYAKEALASSILTHKDAWSATTTTAAKVPPGAQQFVALLDFMCRRLVHFSSEGHRYLYISQVLFPLLHEFHQQCAAHARLLHVKTLVEACQPITPFFAAVNAAQHVVAVLESWDENPFFIELMRKVAESEKSRTQILKMHLQHSKAMLQNAAKAATQTILAREESVAVRQAITGPGAMIGPTAAFSAAYSVGSKTVKSLFGRGTEDQGSIQQAPEAETQKESVKVPTNGASQPEVDAEALLFSRTIFERHVRDYKALVTALIAELEGVVVGAWRRALGKYRKSPLWYIKSGPECVERDVSSELGAAVDVLQRTLEQARHSLGSGECFSRLWKPLVAALDDAIYSTVSAVVTPVKTFSSGTGFSLSTAATAIGAVEPLSPRSSAPEKASWSSQARTQFAVDMNTIACLFQNSCTKNPRAYLRKTFDLCRLVEMPAARLSEIHEALRGAEAEADVGQMEQITTILEACNILTLSPQQVLSFCEEQLGLE